MASTVCGVSSSQRVERRVEVVDREIRQRPAPEGPVPTPAERRIGRVVRTELAGPQPQVPVEARRHLRRARRTPGSLGEGRRAAPGVHLADGTDGAVPDPLGGLAMPLGRAALVAHLRGDARLPGDPGHGAGFRDVVGQRLLAVDVLAGLHREDRDVGVEVVRGGDEDGVDRLLLLQHHPEVLVDGARVVGGLRAVGLFDLGPDRAPPGLSPVVERPQVPLLARVGDGDDLAVGLLEQGPEIAASLAADADDGDVHLVARGHEPRAAQDVAGEYGRGGDGGRRGGHELAAAGSALSAHVIPSEAAPGSGHEATQDQRLPHSESTRSFA